MTSLISSWLGTNDKARPEECHLWAKGSPDGWYQHSKVSRLAHGTPLTSPFQSSEFSLVRWWKRSLPRHIGAELLAYLILYYSVYIVYRTALSEEQKHEFEEVVSYFKSNVDPLSKDLAFLLGSYEMKMIFHSYVAHCIFSSTGFFVKVVVSRWWGQYTRLPSPDTISLQVHGLVMFDEKEEEALQFSHTVMRYTILSYVLAVRRISKVIV